MQAHNMSVGVAARLVSAARPFDAFARAYAAVRLPAGALLLTRRGSC